MSDQNARFSDDELVIIHRAVSDYGERLALMKGDESEAPTVTVDRLVHDEHQRVAALMGRLDAFILPEGLAA